MKSRSKWLALAGVVAAAAILAAFGLNRTAPVEHFTAKVERGDIHDVVEATGIINAVITVQVGSQVSGTIAKLNVRLQLSRPQGRRRRADRPRIVPRCAAT